MNKSEILVRIGAIEDRLALLNIEGAYGRYYDSRNAEAWANLFTEDGIYQGRQLEGMAPQNLVQGWTGLADFCRTEPLNGIHFMHVPYLELDGDRATARVHFQFQASTTDEFSRRQERAVAGYYDVAYVRTGLGWRIKRRVTTYLESSQRTLHSYEPVAFDVWSTSVDSDYQDSRQSTGAH